MQFNRKRLARVGAIVAVALAAGHLVQSMETKTPSQMSRVDPSRPKTIVTLAAGPEVAPPVQTAKAAPMPGPLTASIAAVVAVTVPADAPTSAVVTAEVEPTVDPCAMSLELTAEPGAMIGLMLLSPCHPNERVVIRHSGLAITGQTTATGSLFTTLPAMETAGAVDVMYGTGELVSAAIAIPDMAQMRRFGVQWQADDAYQVNAFEDGATYGEPGHVSAVAPHNAPVGSIPSDGGFLSLLGDSTTDLPLLAEVYTFPATKNAEVVVEAAVTAATCGRELLGETLMSVGGQVEVTDLTLAMPDCDAIGDYLVLNNLVPDMKIAAAD